MLPELPHLPHDQLAGCPVSAPQLGTVYAALWAGHDLGDHVVQTDAQATEKGAENGKHGPKEPRALAGHVASYTATQAAALRAVGVPLLRWRTLAGLAFSAATHAFIDLRWPVRWVLEHTGSAAFAAPQLTAGGELTIPTRFPEQARYHRQLIRVTGNVPLHGPYLADQALHHGCILIAAAIIAGGAQ